MVTKYIVDNLTGQTINGDLTISGKTYIISEVPSTMSGSNGDKIGEISFDENYLYICNGDYVSATPPTVSGGTPTHVFDAEPGTAWDGYGGNYLQTGPPQEVGLTPLAGWYIVDDNGTIRQILSDPVWFSGGAPTPIQNGIGWFLVLDGSYSYSVTNTTITLYETLPTVTLGDPGSGDIWKRVKLEEPSNEIVTYKALLSQTGTIMGTDIGTFNDQLLINETYTIDTYNSGDDFSNVANVVTGIINESGCVFVATGTTPTNWSNGSQVSSNGGLVVNVIENNLGYDLDWAWAPFGGNGYYLAFNSLLNDPYPDVFPKLKTQIFTQTTQPYDLFTPYSILTSVSDFILLNSVIEIKTINWSSGFQEDNLLYYTPVEIKIEQNMNPFIINGSVTSSYPIDNVSVRTFCDGNTIDTYYGNMDNANNITELVSILNSDTDLNFLGTYSDDGNGGVLLTMTTHNKNIFCSNGTITFEVFAD